MVIAARVLVLAALPNLLPLLTASALHKSRSTFLVHTPRYTRVSRFSSMACPINLQARSHNAAATAGTSRPPPTCQASFSLGPEGMLPMPAVGLGTFQVKEEAGYEAVKAAINVRNRKAEGSGLCSSLHRSIPGPLASHGSEQGVYASISQRTS